MLSQLITIISLKFKISAPTWNETFDLPDGSSIYQKYKIILNIKFKNTKQLVKMHQY